MDESQDPKPHVHFDGAAHAPHEAQAGSPAAKGQSLSIWFFCGILTLGYGIVLLAQALAEHFQILGQHNPNTVLANLHPTFWWGVCLFLFGAFYTVRFRPGKA